MYILSPCAVRVGAHGVEGLEHELAAVLRDRVDLVLEPAGGAGGLLSVSVSQQWLSPYVMREPPAACATRTA